jgi:hypothetical protein
MEAAYRLLFQAGGQFSCQHSKGADRMLDMMALSYKNPGVASSAALWEGIQTHMLPFLEEKTKQLLVRDKGGRQGRLRLAWALAARPCANPGCVRMEGCSEGRVRPRFGCRACGCVRYCSRTCGEEDWEAHQKVCAELAAGRQAAGGELPSGNGLTG